MTNRAQDLIHKVLDDMATPTERQALADVMSNNADVAAQFAQLRQLSALLASVPAISPPNGIHQVVMSQIGPNTDKNTFQLSGQSSVFVAPTTRTQHQTSGSILHTFSLRMETAMSEIKKGFFSSTINKVLVGGGVAAAALIAITSGSNFPSGNQDTVGTISPAVRYRSDQGATANVQPSSNGGATSAQISVNTDNAAANSASNAADKAASKGAVNSADKAAMEAADKAASKAASKGAVNSADKAAMEAADKAASKAASKGAVNSADKAAMEAADKAASKAASKGALNSADKAAMEAADKAAAKAASKATN